MKSTRSTIIYTFVEEVSSSEEQVDEKLVKKKKKKNEEQSEGDWIMKASLVTVLFICSMTSFVAK